MATPILSIDHLTLATASGEIVSDLSFEIDRGEIVALTGRSGSGKTSIALAIMGLLPSGIQQTSGTIKWQGDTPLTLPDNHTQWRSLRGTQIGFTQQDVFGAFDPVMKMGTQMREVIRVRTTRSDMDIATELHIKMEEVGLHDIDRLLNSYPHQLSGGQLQRCQLGMVMVLRPPLLIVDEPTSAVDKINQKELLHVFTMIRSKYNVAILCITHEEAVVRQIASREINLESVTGTIERTGLDTLPDRVASQAHSILLEARGVTYAHAFGGMMAKQGATVGPIHLHIFPGRCTGIVGESGSGKSTLAQMLVGLCAPIEGQVLLREKPIDFQRAEDIRGLRKHVQLVMQDGRGSLHPHFTVRQILTEVASLRKKSDPSFQPDVVASLKEVGLHEELLERTSNALSGGECLRVSIARALLLDPEILICDESTSALDRETTLSILNILLRLIREKGLALVLITHDQEVIRRMADDIVVLSEGKVIEKGNADDILHRPTHHVTKKIFETHATY